MSVATLAPERLSPASDRVLAWLDRFETALTAGQVEDAAALFAEDQCFWRDLVAFIWNIKTMEGRQEIAAMLRATLPSVKPRHWQVDGEATETGDLTEGWIGFETETM